MRLFLPGLMAVVLASGPAAVAEGPVTIAEPPAATTRPAAAPTVPGTIAAGEAPVDALLRDPAALVDWLRARNPDLLAAAARIDQARADLGQSRLFQNPALVGSLGDYPVGTTNPPGLGFSDTKITSGALSETVEIGKRGPRMTAARLRLQAEGQAYRDAVAAKAAEARELLARVVYLTAKRKALEESLAGARLNADLQRARVEHGDLSGNDLDRLLVDIITLDVEVDAARRDADEAAASCAAALAAPCAPPGGDAADGGMALLDDAAPLPAVEDPATLVDRRPDLLSLRLNRDAALEDARLAHRKRIPDPNFSLAYTDDNLVVSGDQPHTLAFSIGIPLPIFDRGQHDAARAEGRAAEIGRTADGARLRGTQEASSLLRRRTMLETTLKTLREDALPRSKGVLDATTVATGQGSLGMTDLLLARRTHTDLIVRVMDLQFELFTVRNDLRRVLGLDADAVPEVQP